MGELRDQVAYLWDQLAEWAKEIERRDMIIGRLSQTTSNLTERLLELEAPETPPQEPETVEEGAEPRPATAEAEQPTERPWWRFWG